MSVPRDRWLDWDTGPVVRPYALTKGRTMPASGSWAGLTDVVKAVVDAQMPVGLHLSRAHRRILGLCRHPVMMADLTSDLDLPVGVVRVLIGDLSDYGALRIVAAPQGQAADERLLRDVLHALQAL
jgi:Protein of unknown function (DUF742)